LANGLRTAFLKIEQTHFRNLHKDIDT